MLRLVSAAIAAAALLVSAPAQVGSGRSDATMLATNRYLFVLRGDDLFQFDIDTLTLLHRATLPANPAARSDLTSVLESIRRQQAARPVEEIAEIEEVEEVEPVEEPVLEDRPVATGGKYGSRGDGAAGLARSGGRATAEAISSALRWLAVHQDADGRFDADGFMQHDSERQPTDGPGNAVHDVGLTGLALLAFLGDGNTMRAGPYRETVTKAVSWLCEQQNPTTGLVGTNSSNEFIYDHAIAALAMTEAYGLSRYQRLERNAQKAIDYLESHRNPYMVWRYQPRDGDNDTSVTTWCVMAYRSAKDFGLDVNENTLKIALTWFDQMTDPGSGRTGYTERGGFSSRRAGDHATRFPRERNEAMTAAALFCRFLLGQQPDADPIMVTQADLLLTKPPVWQQGSVDEYAWLFGSLAMYQMGGRYWKDWARHLTEAVVKSQRRDDNFAGSWDPVGVWGEDGGRIYSTAMLCLSLQSYYRYTRLVR